MTTEPTITVIETEATGYREARKELPLSEIEELFRDNDSSLVWPLCKLIRQQEAELERLKARIDGGQRVYVPAMFDPTNCVNTIHGPMFAQPTDRPARMVMEES